MAIAPRCALGGTGITTATTVSPALTGWTNLGGPAGTAPVAGDIVFFCWPRNANSWTLSQTAGTGTWTIFDTGTSNGGTVAFESAMAWRVFDGTETAPTFSTGAATGRFAWAMIAVAPDSGSTVSIDVWATLQKDTTGTSHTANSAAASGTDCSLIFTCLLALANGTTAITLTTPTGWATGVDQEFTGGASSKSCDTNILYQEGVTSTVTPGAETTNVSTEANVYHVLLQETGAAGQNPGLLGVRVPNLHRRYHRPSGRGRF